MKIIINNHEYQNASWNVEKNIGTAGFGTELSIIGVLEQLGENKDIYVYDDNDVMTSKWNNRGVQGITINDGRANVQFVVSILDNNAEEKLQKDIDDGVDAIMELAEMVASMDETIESHGESISGINEDLDNLKRDLASLEGVPSAMAALQGDVSNLQNSVTDLANTVANIPADLPDRFAQLWVAYNDLADRVSALENK